MPISAEELLVAAGLPATIRVPWGAHVPSNAPGVYCVSLSSRPDRNSGTFDIAPISAAALRRWLGRVPHGSALSFRKRISTRCSFSVIDTAHRIRPCSSGSLP
jgi:hypothetical protein